MAAVCQGAWISHRRLIPLGGVRVGRDLNGRPGPLKDSDTGRAEELKQASRPWNLHSEQGAAEALAVTPGEAQALVDDADGVVALQGDE